MRIWRDTSAAASRGDRGQPLARIEPHHETGVKRTHMGSGFAASITRLLKRRVVVADPPVMRKFCTFGKIFRAEDAKQAVMNQAVVLDHRPDDATEEKLVHRAAFGDGVVNEALHKLREGGQLAGDATPHASEDEVGMGGIVTHDMKEATGLDPFIDSAALAHVDDGVAVANDEADDGGIVHHKKAPEQPIRVL